MKVTAWAPSIDVAETPEEYVITAELPGVDKKDVRITIRDGALSIEGERKVEKEEKKKKFHRIERFYGSFSRTFTIPEGVLDDKVLADFDNGLLHVHLPKSETASVRSKEVQIK